MSVPKVSAIVPCRNEEKNLPATIKRLKKVVDEIIVVDNGSSDKSRSVGESCGVKVVTEKRSRGGIGYGYAHMTGLKFASGDYIVAVDADGEHPIELIPQIVKFAQDRGYDFVSCARRTTASRSLKTKIRRLGIFLLSLEVGVLFGKRVTDVLSGMWVLRKGTVPFLGLSEGGWNFSPEIKLAALTNPEIRFTEYPISATVRKNGQSKQILWKTAIEHFLFIFSYRLRQLSMAVPGRNLIARLAW